MIFCLLESGDLVHERTTSKPVWLWDFGCRNGLVTGVFTNKKQVCMIDEVLVLNIIWDPLELWKYATDGSKPTANRTINFLLRFWWQTPKQTTNWVCDTRALVMVAVKELFYHAHLYLPPHFNQWKIGMIWRHPSKLLHDQNSIWFNQFYWHILRTSKWQISASVCVVVNGA